jgi:hypothetical protein
MHDKTTLENMQPENHWGYHIGVFARFELPLCHVQPEILLTSSGATFKKNNQPLKLDFTKLDVPVMLGLSFFKVVRTQLGPIFSLLLSAKEGRKNIKRAL